MPFHRVACPRAERDVIDRSVEVGRRKKRKHSTIFLQTLSAGTKPRTSQLRPLGGERRGKRKRSTIFLERERKLHTIVSQADIGTVSKAMLGKLLIDSVERIWACTHPFPPNMYILPSWTELNWTELNCHNPAVPLFAFCSYLAIFYEAKEFVELLYKDCVASWWMLLV